MLMSIVTTIVNPICVISSIFKTWLLSLLFIKNPSNTIRYNTKLII